MVAVIATATVLSGCSFLSMDSFEPWEPTANDFVQALPDRVLAEFADETHAIAYALAADCFQGIESRSEIDQAIAVACDSEWGRISEIMTMDDLCTWSRFDGNVDVPAINGGDLCG